MKKRVIAIACALLILWGGMFITDFIRCASLRKPLFVVGVTDTLADDGGSGTYRGLGYTVVLEGHLAEVVEGELSTDGGYVIESVEMYVLGKVIAASIT